MPRQSDPIDDRTPLDGARIDVAARVGWLLRTHRTVSGVSLRQMSEALKDHGLSISSATLSRVESEGQRSPAVIDGYTAVLGLPDGGLRATIDGVCRSFSYSPPAPPDPIEQSLDSFSRACDEVMVENPTAGAWLTFARHHAQPAGFGLPLRAMEPLVQQLTDEIGRCLTVNRWTRHDALSQLIASPYGAMTLRTMCGRVEDLDNQLIYDLTSVLSDHPSPDLTAWACRLLASPSLFHVRGASYVLQGMLVHGGLPLASWRTMVPLVREAQVAATGDPDRTAAVDSVVGALPPALHPDLRAAGVRGPARKTSIPWSRTRGNPHYLVATEIARAACADLQQPDEPLLERLLFESCFETRGVRMSTSTWVLLASPFADALARAIVRHTSWPDDECHAAAMRVAAACNSGGPMPGLERLLGEGSLFAPLTILVGRSGGRLTDEVLSRGLAGDETMVRQTFYALGMAGDPRLVGLAEDATRPEAVRRIARWWLDRGPRILV